MAAALPIVCLILLTLLLAARKSSAVGAIRRPAILLAATLCALWLAIGCELLSFLDRLSFTPILFWWLIPAILLSILAVRRRENLFSPWKMRWKLSAGESAVFGAIVLILATAFLSAVCSPPNNADALIWRLPRQVSWMQHRNLAPHPVQNINQLLMPPLADYIGLQLMILSGSDRLGPLVQWLALILTMCGISLLAGQIGAGRTGQLLAAFLVAACPILFLEASNTQDDLILSALLVTLVYVAVQLRAGRKIVWIGILLGLAMLARGTGLILAIPVVILIFDILLHQQKFRALASMLLIAILAVTINLPHWARNFWALGGAFEPPALSDVYRNQVLSPASISSNIVRNLSANAALPSPTWNEGLQRAILALHRGLGIDANDPRTTWDDARFQVAYHAGDENTAPSPLHLALALATPIIAVIFRRRFSRPEFWTIIALGIVCFVLYSTLIKWQPWEARLQAPMLALWMAPVAVVLAEAGSRGVWPVVLIALIELAPNIAKNPHQRPELPESTDQVVQWIGQGRRDPANIGFQLESDDRQYPLQRMLMSRFPRAQFSAFNAKIASSSEDAGAASPDMVITRDFAPTEMVDVRTGALYTRRARFDSYAIYALK